jgi:hypothetical protein
VGRGNERKKKIKFSVGVNSSTTEHTKYKLTNRAPVCACVSEMTGFSNEVLADDKRLKDTK